MDILFLMIHFTLLMRKKFFSILLPNWLKKILTQSLVLQIPSKTIYQNTSWVEIFKLESREYAIPRKSEENILDNNYGFAEEQLHEIHEAENILDNNFFVHSNGSVHNTDIDVCYAFVEYDDFTGVENAIKASTIEISGHQLYIEGRRPNRNGFSRGSMCLTLTIAITYITF
ncbi:hypothetical protein LIER_40881 [Lithospermum erythrorhizon]|uniref:RRM domain-containing protein n=1 Tax=Lithospermum erythrorhizon TaxID=34254 RepID=A0AAV3R0X7_LITER